MSKLEVDAIEPQSGTTITIGSSGDTVNLIGTLNSNGSPLPGDISSVVAGTGLSGGGTTGAVTINIEAAQPTITSLGTITSFRSTGIDDNSNALAMTIDSSENVGIKNTTMASFSNLPATDLVVGAGSTASGITIYSGTSSGSNIAFADGASGDARNQGIIQYHHNGDYMRFFTSASERMRLNSTGLALKTSAPAVTLDVRATSFTPYNTNTSLIVEAPAVFSQAQHFYIYNAGSFNNGRPTGGIGAVNASSLISLSAGSICTGNPGADGFKATATSSSLYDIGSGNHEFKTKTSLTVGDQFTHQTRMIIKDSGRVGIGETAPLGTLHVKSADSGASVNTDADELIIENGTSGAAGGISILSATNGYGNINFGDSGDNNIGIIQYDHPNNKMKFFTAAAERMNIDSNGFVNIGNPDVTGQFQVKGGGFIIAAETTAGTNSSIVYSSKRSSNGAQFRFTQSSTVCGDITTNGSAVTYGSNSDYRLKENVSYDFDATTRLKQLKPARFNFIVDETNTLIDGFIAHEVQSVVPEAVTGTHNQVEVWKDNEELPEGVSIGDNKLDADGNTIPEYQGIDQSKLVPLLVKTIQELEARITTLENA